MKKLLCLYAALLLVLLTACGSSSGSGKVYTLEGCSYKLPASWTDNSTDNFKMYTDPDDTAAVNVSFDDQSPEYRTPLADQLQDVAYDLEAASIDGHDVDVFVYRKDDFFYHDFEVVLDDKAYHFTFISKNETHDYYEPFLKSIKFNE